MGTDGSIGHGDVWKPGAGACATAYMRHEKRFLNGVFARFPNLKQSFAACEKDLPCKRLQAARRKMTLHTRQVWEDFGIPQASRETLAEHVGQMMLLANLYPQNSFDYTRTIAMIAVWGMPLTIVGEIPLHDMDRPQRHELRALAAKMVFDDYRNKDHLNAWRHLDLNTLDESRFVNDLDYIVTARKARDYQAMYPDYAENLETLVHSCRVSLMTDEAKLLFDDIVPKMPDIINVGLHHARTSVPAFTPQGAVIIGGERYAQIAPLLG